LTASSLNLRVKKGLTFFFSSIYIFSFILGSHVRNLEYVHIEISQSVLREKDGPMLLHGLQNMDGRILEVPRQKISYPDPERLGVR
jgi:hypothetical protein